MKTLTTTVDDDGVVYKTFQAFFKTPYNHDVDAESERTALYTVGPTMTQQHQSAETDINNIVKNFGITGKLPLVEMPPTYTDFSEVFDFQSAMNTLKEAQDSFAALPANIRSRFENDPARFVAYVDHCLEREDIEPLREMGLAVPRAKETPQPPPEATPAPNASETAPKAP
jgi:hypothetical protein